MNGGYVLVPAWLLDLKPDGAELRAYVHLARFGRFDTAKGIYEECRPALGTLAEAAGMSETHMKRALAGLAEKGAIERRQRVADDGRTSLPSVYRVIFGAIVGPGGAAGGRGEGSADGPQGGPPVADNPEPPTQNQNTQKTESPSPAALELCELLQKRIEENGSRKPSITKAWTDAARLLMEKDGFTRDQVAWMIEWSQRDSFWKSNVLSMPTLRKQFDRLKLRALEEHNASRRPTSGTGTGTGAAPAAPRYPNSAERQDAQSRSNKELGRIAEQMVQETGSKPTDPEHAKKVIAVFKRLKAEAAQTGSAPRTSMPYIDGEVIRETGAQREVTSGGGL